MQKLNIIVILGAFLVSPVFVSANTCLVDSTSTNNKTYKTINESLENNCKSITIKSGEYVEDIVVGDGVKITGAGNATNIHGLVKMNGVSGVKDLRVSNPTTRDSNGRTIGIKIEKDAEVVIYGVEVSGADIGIESSAGSNLTVVESKLTKNKKGFYIRYGTTIDIRNSEVIENEEEGIDVRAGIKGSISGNTILRNGESGIEIVMGESKMKINSNIIKNNQASGIALQFYKDNSDLGDFFIAGNELIGNDSYGIACKRPSGGKTEKQYWAKSTKFGYNRIRENRKGLFKGCKFNGPKQWEASRTKKAQKELNRVLEEIKATYKTMTEKEMVSIVNERMGTDDDLIQKDGWWQQEIDRKKKKEIDKVVDKVEWEYNETVKKNEKLLESTSKIREFFLGPHKQVLEDLKGDLDKHNFNVQKTKKIVNKIEIEYIKTDALKQVDKIEKRKELQEMYNQYKNKFGIWPWLRGLF